MDDFSKLVWSSDWRFIDAACNSGAGVNEVASHSLYVDKGGYSFFPTDTDQHYSFKISDLTKNDKKEPQPSMQELKGKEVVVAANFTAGLVGTTGVTRTETTWTEVKDKGVDIYHVVSEDAPFGDWWDKETFELSSGVASSVHPI